MRGMVLIVTAAVLGIAGGVSASSEWIWIGRSDGTKSCDSAQTEKAKTTLALGAKELEAASVKVLESKKAKDGRMRMQVCGAPSGSMDSYRISKDDLGAAKRLGFEELKSVQTP